MNRNQIISAALLAVFLLAAGYWWGRSTDDGNNRTAPATDGRAADADAGADEPRRVLYYRNPMGHDDTSAVPKKDPMGMDYIPVYADEVPDGPEVRISANRLQTLGVRIETARSWQAGRSWATSTSPACPASGPRPRRT